MAEERVNFGSKIGVILATAGSAVGLGNIWRFPYMTGENGGAAFILIYVACVFILGIPCMIGEFLIGRHGASNTARAYTRLAKGSNWRWIGYLEVLTGFLITGYYAVVSGWCLNYIVIFGITHFIIVHGVRNGIEKASKLMMPTLFILLLVIVVAACLLPGATKGIDFLFKPDFSKVTRDVFLGALGQCFYSLSIGMGCLCTYASYFSRQTNIKTSAIQIGLIDLLVAILAGLMIFPAAFSVGISPDSGPSLIFITLPNVFNQAFSSVPVIGWVVALLFYALLSLAALTSLISLHEVNTAFFYEELHITRKAGAWIVTIACCLIGAICSISIGQKSSMSLFGMDLFDLFDFVTGQLMLPICGLLMCLFVGWVVPKQIVKDELSNWGTLRFSFYKLFLFTMRFVCPLCILAIMLHQFHLI